MSSQGFGYNDYQGNGLIIEPTIPDSCDKPIANSYIEVSRTEGLAVELATVKSYLRIDGTSEDAIITLLINNATEIAEKYTRREFLNKRFRTFRDYFTRCMELQRSRLQEVHSITYLDENNEVQTLASDMYRITSESGYSKVYTAFEREFPEDAKSEGYQNVTIEFTAGYGTTAADIPADIQLAIMMIANNLYANRGDCGCGSDAGSIGSAMPEAAKAILNQYRILRIF